MLKDFLRFWVRITFGRLFWIVAVQLAWAAMLVFWFLAYARQHAGKAPGPGLFGWGLVLLALMIFGVNVLVIHFARQSAQNRVVKDFVSRVSHDLRSPLASVKLHLETVLKREISPEQTRDCLEAALQDLGRLETSIEGVLTASRLERQKLRTEPRSVDLGAFLRRYLARKDDMVARSGGSLDVGDLQGLWVRADPAMMEKVMDNLVDNALCHCQPGVRIRVSLAQKNRLALVTVADDGPGIAPRERRKVFRLFYRAPAARGRGTGLGLFIVDSLVKAQGGQVWVESPGAGSIFQVALPLDEEAAGRP
jgi:signal transduction histidine kinase